MQPDTSTHFSFWRLLSIEVRRRLLARLTSRSLPMFLRPQDLISHQPMVDGSYEPQVRALIEQLASDGHDGFLFDIGANIGLTSCQSGDAFKRVFLFEPNPGSFAILGVNCALSLRKARYELFNFGLAPQSGNAELTVPRFNWGGAFVRGLDNAYSDELLARKDNLPALDPANYRTLEIRLESAAERLAPLFEGLAASGLTRGVFKIDVEGYERPIIGELAKVLPPAFGAAIVFENWDPALDVAALIAPFGRPCRLFRLAQTPAGDARINRHTVLTLLRHNGVHHRLEAVAPGSPLQGDLLLIVDAVA